VIERTHAPSYADCYDQPLNNGSLVSHLPHGYTNRTRRVGLRIEKCFEGPVASERARREFQCLSALKGRLPLPTIVDFDESVPKLVTENIAGRHGQELIHEGHAQAVLHLIGEQLASLQRIDPTTIPDLRGEGDVIVHGDFGPQNMLFAPDMMSVAALLDWESAHLGSQVEDPAWAEWIVRMHHPYAISSLPDLFEGARLAISWRDRHAAMSARCFQLLEFCKAGNAKAGVAQWEQRLRTTERWTENPSRE